MKAQTDLTGIKNLAKSFLMPDIETTPLSPTMLVDFDLDNETVSVCDSSDNAWRSYRLHDLSVAAFKGYRGDYYSSDDRERIFKGALAGREIDIEGELLSETEPPTMKM